MRFNEFINLLDLLLFYNLCHHTLTELQCVIEQSNVFENEAWVLVFWGSTGQKSAYLNTIVAGRDTAVLHLDVGRGMCEFTLGIGPGALVPLELPANFQLEPARVLPVQQIIHVDHSHRTDRTISPELTKTLLNIQTGRELRNVDVGRRWCYNPIRIAVQLTLDQVELLSISSSY